MSGDAGNADRPLVLSDYLSDEGVLFLSSGKLRELVLAHSGDAESDPDLIEKLRGKLRKQLRGEWMNGGNLLELIRYELQLEERNVTQSQIAERLDVTPASVTGWFNLNKGIESSNLELLRRVLWQEFRCEYVHVARFERDFAGYVRAVSCQKKLPGNVYAENQLSDLEFWRLWFLFRSRPWLHGQRTKSQTDLELAAQQIGADVAEIARRDGTLDEARTEAIRQETTVAHLLRLMESWGAPYVLTIDHLDYLCWTSPYA